MQADPGPILTIRLFGTFEALLNAVTPPRLRLRDGERLLAYLVLQQGLPISYRALAQQFWPAEARINVGDQGDFTNTRQAVRSLRLALGSESGRLTSPGKGVVSLDLTGADVDVLAFDRLVAGSAAAGWQEAVALVRGPLLEGWTEPWAVEARARRGRSYQRTLQRLIAHARAQSDPAQEAAYLRPAAEFAPQDETLWRELMQALAQQRQFDQVEETYDRLCELVGAREARLDAETETLIVVLRKEARSVRTDPFETDRRPTPHREQDTGLASNRARVQVRPSDVGPAVSAVKPLNAERPQVTILYKRDARPDEEVLLLLEREMTAAGFRVFIDRHIAIGTEWAIEIERQLRASTAIIPLISSASIHSEMLEYEIKTAQEMARNQNGLPRILPVRVAYDGPLPERSALEAILTPLQYTLWQSSQDDAWLVARIIEALRTPPKPHVERVRLETAGGAVALDSPFYIERPADREFNAALLRPDSIVLIKGARQMGKTSLLARGLQQARQMGARVVRIDFQALNEAQLATLDTLLFTLATTLAVQLDLPPPTRKSWNPAFGPNMNLELFLRRKVLGASAEPLVWGLDEVDRLFTCPFASEVFGLFRSWHNLRSLDPTGPWGRFTLAMAYATEAHLFITDPNQSPFNVGVRLALDDFSPEQVSELNRRYGQPLRDADETRRFHHLVNGQPFLTRRGLDELAKHELDLTTLEAKADREDGPFGDHLRRLLAALAPHPELIASVRGILRGVPPERDAFYRLRSVGLVVGETASEARPRCRLYASYLTKHLLATPQGSP